MVLNYHLRGAWLFLVCCSCTNGAWMGHPLIPLNIMHSAELETAVRYPDSFVWAKFNLVSQTVQMQWCNQLQHMTQSWTKRLRWHVVYFMLYLQLQHRVLVKAIGYLGDCPVFFSFGTYWCTKSCEMNSYQKTLLSILVTSQYNFRFVWNP